MPHQYRHRSPFHLRAPADPGRVPLVIIDGPSPLGAAASTFIALGLLGVAGSVHATSVAELRPHLRSRRLPTLAELAAALRHRGAGWSTFDVVGVGVGAMVALRLALDGGPVRRIVAVDAPVPTYPSSGVLAIERFFTGTTPRPPARPSSGDPAVLVLEQAHHVGALPVGVDPSWFRRPLEHLSGRGHRETIPTLADSELTQVDRPVLCINSPRSAIVTGGDHVARVVPTSKLLRLSTMDPADESEQARVADALADFLYAEVPEGPAYRAARRPVGAPAAGSELFPIGETLAAAPGPDPVA